MLYLIHFCTIFNMVFKPSLLLYREFTQDKLSIPEGLISFPVCDLFYNSDNI